MTQYVSFKTKEIPLKEDGSGELDFEKIGRQACKAYFESGLGFRITISKSLREVNMAGISDDYGLWANAVVGCTSWTIAKMARIKRPLAKVMTSPSRRTPLKRPRNGSRTPAQVVVFNLM